MFNTYPANVENMVSS